jgi:hydroxyquinol 1,2-dioxygenase
MILLSDTLAVSTLVDLVAHASRQPSATESTLLGPFFREGSPLRTNGESIAAGLPGDPILVRGRVTDAVGSPVSGATVETWHSDEEGLYDVQREDDRMNLRGTFHADWDGRFEFSTVRTHSYPIPTDGPVGTLLQLSGRHPFRPAHYHFRITAPRYETLTTALYMENDSYLDSDAVFGVRDSLIVSLKSHGEKPEIEVLEYEFVLNPEKDVVQETAKVKR